jgi:hypothetical protein
VGAFWASTVPAASMRQAFYVVEGVKRSP